MVTYDDLGFLKEIQVEDDKDKPELCDKYQKDNQERKKCRLLSEELSNKLHQIYSDGKSGYIPPISYGLWLKLDKKDIREKSEVKGETLCFNFVPARRYTETLSPELNTLHEIRSRFYDAKAQESYSARTSALSQINNSLTQGNIDLTELGIEYFCLREECLCNGELSPTEEAKYHITHLNKYHLKSLTNREAITNYQTTQIEKDIKNLVSAKSKSAQE
ncbi:11910_t:CDS:2, partial [Ambispora leptoticha]